MTSPAELPALLARTVETLVSRGAQDEAIAEYHRTRGRFSLRRGPYMKPVGRAWRLGVLLLGTDGSVAGIGKVTRAVEPGHANNQALSAEERRDVRRAAHDAAFPDGEVVNYDVVPLDRELLGEPLVERDGAVFVRWRPGRGDDALMPIAAYIDDRLSLLPE